MARDLDHCVLPTGGLAVARARLAALGFTVAPAGIHPFGTENVCVYFADGTFLEPLSVGDCGKAGQAAASGNVFVSRDRAFRARRGEEGFSALVFSSADADADHAAFAASNISAGDRLDFSRPFVDASGKADTASFRLAFAGEPAAPDALFFTCERAGAPKVDRSALERHENGVAGIAKIILTAENPDEHAAFLAALTAAPPERTQSGLVFRLPKAVLALLSPNAFVASYGVAPPDDPALRLSAIVFATRDVEALETVLVSSRIGAGWTARHLVVPPAAGQGAVFAFGSA